MLSVPDAEVVARDPALPGLSLLLDTPAFLAWLQENAPESGGWPLVPVALECAYLRYKPGVRLLGAYRMRTAQGEVVPLQAWAVSEGGMPKLEKSIGEQAAGSLPTRRWCRTLRVMVQFHPDDRDLPSLGAFATPGAREALLYRRIPALAGRYAPSLRILSYKPERRFVAALDDTHGPAAVVRGCTEERFGRSLRGAQAFRSQRGKAFRIPRLLGHSRTAAILVQEWLQGEPVSAEMWNQLDPGSVQARAARIGAALFHLHGQEAAPLRREENQDLLCALRGIAAVRPGNTSQAARHVAAALPSLLASESGVAASRVPLHGDFHPGQIVWCEGAPGLVDFDRAAFGDPLTDLASFVAHLESWCAAGCITVETSAAAEDGLVEGYEEAGGRVDPRAFQLRCAAALLRRAPLPFRERIPDWPAVTDALVSLASLRLRTAGAGA